MSRHYTTRDGAILLMEGMFEVTEIGQATIERIAIAAHRTVSAKAPFSEIACAVLAASGLVERVAELEALLRTTLIPLTQGVTGIYDGFSIHDSRRLIDSIHAALASPPPQAAPAPERDGWRVEIFWHHESGGFIAFAPELPGCSAFGKTRGEALHEIQLAIPAWIEAQKAAGNPLPAPPCETPT